MTPVVRAATPDDLPAITALYGREVTGGTATFELVPPSLDEISDSKTSAASIRLHVRLGFRRVGVYAQVGWKFDRWLDVTLMQMHPDPTGAAPTAPGSALGGGLA